VSADSRVARPRTDSFELPNSEPRSKGGRNSFLDGLVMDYDDEQAWGHVWENSISARSLEEDGLGTPVRRLSPLATHNLVEWTGKRNAEEKPAASTLVHILRG
jgi:hypothetical protein